MKHIPTLALALAFSAIPVFSHASSHPVGNVYTQSNQVAGNSILIYNRFSDGHLEAAGSVSTGGLGTGAGLGNQNGVTLSQDGRFLYAVNAGSNSVSIFEVSAFGRLSLRDVQPSCGVRPISVTQSGNLVYVLNDGQGEASASIQGFFQSRRGELTAIPGASSGLSQAHPGSAQIQFTPKGDGLVVTEKATNTIDTFDLDRWGRPSQVSFQASVGQTPFGFDFDRRGRLFVSEAFGGATDASALSSYRLSRNLDLTPISPSAPTTETAACWTVVSNNGRYAYTTNAGSGSVSGYRIASDGSLSLIDAGGVSGSTGAGSAPIDIVITNNDRFVYVLAGGSHSIVGFRVESSGNLTPIDTDGGLPGGTNGLAVR